MATCEVRAARARSVSLSGDGELLLSAYPKGPVALWQLPTGVRKWSTQLHGETHAVAISADGTTLMAGDDGGTSWVWRRGAAVAVAATGPAFSRPRSYREAADDERAFEQAVVAAEELLDAGDGRRAAALARALRTRAGYERHPVARDLRARVAARGARRTRLVAGWLAGECEYALPAACVALRDDGDVIVGGHDGVLRHGLRPLGSRFLAWHGAQVRFVGYGDEVFSAAGDCLYVTPLDDPRAARALFVGTLVGCAALDEGAWFALTGHEDGSVRVWDLTAGASVRTIDSGLGAVAALALAPDLRRALVADERGGGVLVDVATGARVCELTGHDGTVLAAAFSGDGRTLVTGGADGMVRIWDADASTCRHVEGHASAVTATCPTADGEHVLTASLDGAALVWSVRDEAVVRRLRPHAGPIEAAAMTPDGRHVAVAAHLGVSRWALDWDHDWPQRADPPRALEDLPDDEPPSGAVPPPASAPAPAPSPVRARELVSVAHVATLGDHDDGALAVALTRYGRLALTGGGVGSVRVWDLDGGGEPARSLDGHSWREPVRAVAITGDGRTALSGSDDGTARVWDVASGDCRQVLEGGGPVRSVAITPDGRLALTVSGAGVRLWDADAGSIAREVNPGDVLAAALTADASIALLAFSDALVLRWAPDHCALLGMECAHEGDVLAAAITPDGRRAITTGWQDSRACVWDADGRCNAEWETVARAAAISADGCVGLTAGPSGAAELSDLDANAALATLEGHTDEIHAVALTADAGLAATASIDETVRIWRLVWGPRSPVPADWASHAAAALDTFRRMRMPYAAMPLSRIGPLREGAARWDEHRLDGLLRELADAGLPGLDAADVARELHRRDEQ